MHFFRHKKPFNTGIQDKYKPSVNDPFRGVLKRIMVFREITPYMVTCNERVEKEHIAQTQAQIIKQKSSDAGFFKHLHMLPL